MLSQGESGRPATAVTTQHQHDILQRDESAHVSAKIRQTTILPGGTFSKHFRLFLVLELRIRSHLKVDELQVCYEGAK